MEKSKSLFFTVWLVVFALSANGTGRAMAADQTFGQSSVNTPKAVVIEKEYIFDQVLDGEIVSHAYLIENQGTAPLKILNVRTSCGCTTARRPEIIEPGTSGQIEVKGDTRGYGGHVFNKTITVFTNDPLTPQLRLQLKGPVDLFARIDPTRIVLRGEAGRPLTAQATITPNPEHPFRIMDIIAEGRLAEKIEARMEPKGGQYVITLTNRLNIPGQYRGRLVIKTDSSLQPQLALLISGHVLANRARLGPEEKNMPSDLIH